MSASVSAATDELNRALQPGIDRDWSVPAGDVEWSCRHTAAHIADDLFSYASQVIAQPEHGYLPIEAVLDPVASNHEILEAVSMCGRLLRLAVETTSVDARAWHPQGTSDPDGFAAMGVLETLVHTYDIAKGLGLDWIPPGRLCEQVVERLFPGAPDGDPARVLLYATGRGELPGRPRQLEWSWNSAVREERTDASSASARHPCRHVGPPSPLDAMGVR